MKIFLRLLFFMSSFTLSIYAVIDLNVSISQSIPCNMTRARITFAGADASCNFDELPVDISYPEELVPGFVIDEGQFTNVGAFTDTMLTVTKENQFNSYFTYAIDVYFVATEPGSHDITVSGTDSMGTFHETTETINADFHVLAQSQVCVDKNTPTTINLGDLITPGTTSIQNPTIPGDTTIPNNPQNGSVSAVGPGPDYPVIYTPDANYCGPDFFDYAVNDVGTFCELCQRVYIFVGKDQTIAAAQACYKDFLNLLYNDIPFEFAQCPFAQCATHVLGNLRASPNLYWLNLDAFADISQAATPVSLNVSAGGGTIDSFDPDTLIVLFSGTNSTGGLNTFQIIDQNNCIAPFSFTEDTAT